MTYGELKTLIQDIHTNGPMASTIDNLTKIVLGKIARVRPKFTERLGEVTVNDSREINLTTALPDFICAKKDVSRGKDIYYIRGNSNIFLTLTSFSKFKEFEYDNYAAIKNNILYLPKGFTLPETIYIPYFSSYLVLDEDGITHKSKPVNTDDTFLLTDLFEDVLVDGILLYLKRRELDNSEYSKQSKEWREQLQSLVFYN